MVDFDEIDFVGFVGLVQALQLPAVSPAGCQGLRHQGLLGEDDQRGGDGPQEEQGREGEQAAQTRRREAGRRDQVTQGRSP